MFVVSFGDTIPETDTWALQPQVGALFDTVRSPLNKTSVRTLASRTWSSQAVSHSRTFQALFFLTSGFEMELFFFNKKRPLALGHEGLKRVFFPDIVLGYFFNYWRSRGMQVILGTSCLGCMSWVLFAEFFCRGGSLVCS